MQGGVGDFTHRLGQAFVRLGHQVLVVTSHKILSASSSPLSMPSGESTDNAPQVAAVLKEWGWTSWNPMLQAASKWRADILHVQYQTAAFGMHPAINFLPLRLQVNRGRPRLVYTFHDLRVPYLFPKAGAVRQWVTLLPAHWSDAAIATNREDYVLLSRELRGAGRRIASIPIGSNIDPRPPSDYSREVWRHRLGIEAGDKVLCYFGFINASKGVETLARTLDRLREDGIKVKLLMVGGRVGDSDPANVAYLQRVEALAQQLGIADSILWTGYAPTEHVSAHLLAADVCLLPYLDGASFRRGSLMAALAHGLPIVSTRPESDEPLIVDGENMLLVPAGDHNATAEAVRRLLNSPDLSAKLSKGALGLAQGFSWEAIAAKHVQLYASLLEDSPSLRPTATENEPNHTVGE